MSVARNRWKQDSVAKQTTSDYLSIDIRHIKRKGFLKPGERHRLVWRNSEGEPIALVVFLVRYGRIIFAYPIYDHKKKEWDVAKCTVFLEWTNCHFGGSRPWFVCPGCGSRVAILYMDKLLQCRKCLDLVYDSQRECQLDRILRRKNKIRKKLGWDNGNEYSKPKGMHKKTFMRLWDEHDSLDQAFVVALAKKFKLI